MKMGMRRGCGIILVSWRLALASIGAAAQSAPETDSPIQQVQPGVFEIGGVRLDKAGRSVSFSATVNQDEGPIEYALVTGVGKLHESLLRANVEPIHIHLAFLLLATNGPSRVAALRAETQGGTRAQAGGERTPFIGKTNDPVVRKTIPGGSVSLWVSWRANEAEKRVPLEEMILNEQTAAAASRGPWIYNGSRLVEGAFLAQRDGSIVAIIEDTDALINNPRPGRENDQIWRVNPANLPPKGAPVRFTIQLATKDEKLPP